MKKRLIRFTESHKSIIIQRGKNGENWHSIAFKDIYFQMISECKISCGKAMMIYVYTCICRCCIEISVLHHIHSLYDVAGVLFVCKTCHIFHTCAFEVPSFHGYGECGVVDGDFERNASHNIDKCGFLGGNIAFEDGRPCSPKDPIESYNVDTCEDH